MKKYKIEMREIYKRVVDIEANTLEEAMDIIAAKYDVGEIVMYEDDIKEVLFTPKMTLNEPK